MSPQRIASLPSVRRQHLLVEFASLRYVSPQGVYVSLSPDDPTLWSGVIFVRKGPYAPAILRFQISFPADYPWLPPLVTFATDIFHPLLTPLTTYTYTTGSSDNDTVSATDDERLPPGGYSLRHGFPHWFGRARRTAVGSAPSSRNPSASGTSLNKKPDYAGASHRAEPATPIGSSTFSVSPSMSGGSSRASLSPDGRLAGSPGSTISVRSKQVPVAEILLYIRSTFDDEAVLDSVPLTAAGNPGAWHAWRSHRLRSAHAKPFASLNASEDDGLSEDDIASDDLEVTALSTHQRLVSNTSGSGAKRPGDWNWEGVWEERVKKGIEGSLADPVLYGHAGGGDDLIRFLNMDQDMVDAIKENLRRSVETAVST